jgi:sugar transferase (PEP-CTERM/EpsH1 system associated)
MSAAAPPLVLHVIHHLVVGGMENGLVNLVNRMPEGRFRHAIACIEDHSDFRLRLQRDVEVIALNRSRRGLWRTRYALYRLCRRLRPAIVHTRNMSGLDALVPARLAGVRCCIHGEHGWDVGDLRGHRLRPALLRRLHAPAVDHYVTVSHDLERYLVDRVRIAPARITAICNGVDLERFAPGRESDRHSLPPAMRDASVVVIGTVGRLQPVKNQAALLDAFAQLGRRDPRCLARLRLAIAGDGPMLATLRARADALGIAERVWFAGSVGNVASILRQLDVFVLPSLNEGISNTILEAMATALPIVATDVGGNAELVVDGETGALVAAQDVGALADAIARYALDPKLARRHGAAGRARAEALYGIDGMVARYAALYERLLQRRDPVARGDAATISTER